MTIVLAVVGGAADPDAGLRAGALGALTLALLATVWHGSGGGLGEPCVCRVRIRGCVCVCWRSRLVDQPPRWAMLALLMSVLAIGLRRSGWPILALWPRPLSIGALVASGGAVLLALGLQAYSTERQALQPLSATVALAA